MSLNFNEPMNDLTKEMIDNLFGDAVAARDDHTALLDGKFHLQQQKIQELANTAGQPVNFEMNSVGDIKALRDGTQYRATPAGWKKL